MRLHPVAIVLAALSFAVVAMNALRVIVAFT
jgi:hypothetical protein